jgi:hypothetical protein
MIMKTQICQKPKKYQKWSETLFLHPKLMVHSHICLKIKNDKNVGTAMVYNWFTKPKKKPLRDEGAFS